MLVASTIRKVRTAASRFAGANQGNIAVIFAIALVPLIGFIGVAVDYTRANSARSAMQAALDSTALILSKDLSDGRISSSQIDAKAKAYFAALYTNRDSTVATPDIHGTYTPRDPATGQSTIAVTGSGYVASDFLKIPGFSFPRLNFNTGATSTWGNARLRVALVLDVTGSMDKDDKMANLQTAAKGMIDTLAALNRVDGDVYISVIPFSRDVNILGTAAAAYVTGWPAWEAEPATIRATKPANWKSYGPGSTACPFNGQKFTCVISPVSGSPDGPSMTPSQPFIPASGSYKGFICPGADSDTDNYYNGCYNSVDLGTTTTRTLCTGSSCKCDASHGEIGGTGSSCTCTGKNSSKTCSETTHDYSHTWVVNAHSTWNGCVVDRDQPNDTNKVEPTLGDATTQFYVEQYVSCPLALKPLSNNFATLKTQVIDKLTPAGNTNQAIGGAWGYLSLSDRLPLTAPPTDPGYTYNNYVVLVSDGLNTQNRWTSDPTLINNRERILCDNMKTQSGIQIFAVQINTSTTKPDPTSAVLQYCAGSLDNFQEIRSSADTAKAFQNIATQLARLRVAH
jgi:Flp pilus assembly protein TadG